MKRNAYTFVELLVVIVVIAVLVAIGIPMVARYREQARTKVCEDNLRQFGVGFNIFADRDPSKKYCTNAFDLQRDGCPDTNSWVGNLISLKEGVPGNMLCPTNPVRGIESLNQLIGNAAGGSVVTQTLEGVKLSDITGDFCKDFVLTVDPKQASPNTPDNPTMNPGTQANGSATRLDVVKQAVQDGFNTNYSQSWFLARQELRVVANSKDPKVLQTRGNQRDQSGGHPGCTRRYIEMSMVATSAVPMLGDMTPGDVNQAVLSDTLRLGLQKGDRLGVAFGNGPSYINAPTVTAGVGPSLAILSVWTTENAEKLGFVATPNLVQPQLGTIRNRLLGAAQIGVFIDDTLPLPDQDTYGGVDIAVNGNSNDGEIDRNIHGLPDGYGGQDGILVLQDTRNFRAVHGWEANKQCNVLFADTSVKAILDLNGDGYINPGFPVTPTANPSKEEREILRATSGYENNRAEVAPAEFFNGPLLDYHIVRPAIFCEGC